MRPDPEPGHVTRATQRLKQEQSRVIQRVEDTRARLERARPHSPLIDATFRAFERDVNTGGVVLAGAVAFRVFLFIVPYVFVLVVGFGLAADAANQDPGSLARDAGIGGLVAQAVAGSADLSGLERVTTLVVALIALVLGTRALVKVLRIVSGLIWGVSPPKLKNAGKAIVGVLALMTLAFALSTLLDELRERSFLLGLGGIIVTTAIPFAVALIMNVLLPHQPTRWPDLVPGALFLALGVLVLHLITVYWIAHEVESKTDTYGAIGAALAILLWSYLLGRLITASLTLNATLWQRRTERAERRAARTRIAATHDPDGAHGYTPPGAGAESRANTPLRTEGRDGRDE
jgi:uncharacterized BrkB/YihY/UPF0761 family membrane protein